MLPAVRPLDYDRLGAAAELLAASCPFDDAHAVADELLFGPAPEATAQALGAFAGTRLVGVASVSRRWIRVVAVSPSARNHGVGTALLTAAEALALGLVVRLLDQPGNYLAPGLDLRNSHTIAWLERRGYQRGAERTNLLVDVTARDWNSRALDLAAQARGRGYSVRRATRGDAHALLAHVRQAYNEAWAFEVERALAHEPTGVHLAFAADGAETPAPIAAFAAHDGNNQGLGWFGPAGTEPAHRRRGLGEALLAACLADVADAGHAQCEVAWIGPRAFYERAADVVGERRFVAMTRETR